MVFFGGHCGGPSCCAHCCHAHGSCGHCFVIVVAVVLVTAGVSSSAVFLFVIICGEHCFWIPSSVVLVIIDLVIVVVAVVAGVVLVFVFVMCIVFIVHGYVFICYHVI